MGSYRKTSYFCFIWLLMILYVLAHGSSVENGLVFNDVFVFYFFYTHLLLFQCMQSCMPQDTLRLWAFQQMRMSTALRWCCHILLESWGSECQILLPNDLYDYITWNLILVHYTYASFCCYGSLSYVPYTLSTNWR